MRSAKPFVIIMCVMAGIVWLLIREYANEPKGLSLPTGIISIEYPVEGEKRVVIVEAEEELAVVNEYLSGWDSHLYCLMLRDTACEIELHFESGSTVFISCNDNYGWIQGDRHHGYCFPEQFLIWLREKTR